MAINACAAPVLSAVHNTSEEFWLFSCRTSGSRHSYTMLGLCVSKCHSSCLNALFLLTEPRFNNNCTTDLSSIRGIYEAACVATGLAVASLPCDTDPAKEATPRCEQMVGMDLSVVSTVWKAEAQLPRSRMRPGCNRGWVRDASESKTSLGHIQSVQSHFWVHLNKITINTGQDYVYMHSLIELLCCVRLWFFFFFFVWAKWATSITETTGVCEQSKS